MTTMLFLDFETRSLLNVKDVGSTKYARHPSTRPLMLAWALNDLDVELWVPCRNPEIPEKLLAALQNPKVTKCAWNAAFERHIFQYCLNRWIPYEQWIDPSIWARHLSMPGSLEDVSEILGLGDLAKIKDGDRLKQLFSVPAYKGGEESLFGLTEPAFRDWNTDPADWALFEEYCRQDVRAERALLQKMKALPLPELEQRGWILDQKINDAGVPVDETLVANGLALALRAKKNLEELMKQLTEVANPNSNPQILAWLRTQGYPYNSLAKNFVALALEDAASDFTLLGRKVLTIRKAASKTAYHKFEAIQEAIIDGRIHEMFLFMGAARTARWASKIVNVQNLTRPISAVEENLDLALKLIREMNYDEIARAFMPKNVEIPEGIEHRTVMDVITSCIRSVFQAPLGKQLIVCDLNAIENRVLGWIARCPAIMRVFEEGRCPYLDFAAKVQCVDYKDLKAAYDAGDKTAKHHRQQAKPAVLGCGYRLGGGVLREDKHGDTVKTGLWGYANQMGVSMSQEEAHQYVQIFRDAYPEVKKLWYDLEEAVIHVMRHGGRRAIGSVTIDRKKRKDTGKFILRIKLPSGRYLHYLDAELATETVEGRNGPYERTNLTYMGIDQETKQWVRLKTHGGWLTENIDSAISRDILLNAMLLAEELGAEIVGSVHDEIIVLADKEDPFSFTLDELQWCMSQSPKWAADLLLAAAGFESQYYKK